MGDPTWMYRKGPDGVQAEIFDSDEIPPGWVDTPDKAEEQPKRGRPRKVKDGDGA